MFAEMSEYLDAVFENGDHMSTENMQCLHDHPQPCRRQLPKIELISLLTDVSGMVREKSQFTQYLNYCYSLSKNSKPVLVDILPPKSAST